jgi:hypothetical protein
MPEEASLTPGPRGIKRLITEESAIGFPPALRPLTTDG